MKIYLSSHRRARDSLHHDRRTPAEQIEAPTQTTAGIPAPTEMPAKQKPTGPLQTRRTFQCTQ